MKNSVIKTATSNPSRRTFLRTASVAAAAGFTLADSSLFAATAAGHATETPGHIPTVHRCALQEDVKALQAAPEPGASWTERSSRRL